MRHLLATGWGCVAPSTTQTLSAIETAIAETERTHGGEIRFAVEANLSAPELWRGLTPRERALQVFAQLSVWDTEANNGVLIYVLWADHDVEIVARSRLQRRVTPQEWSGGLPPHGSVFAAGDTAAGRGRRRPGRRAR